jgi:hypothetical protein
LCQATEQKHKQLFTPFLKNLLLTAKKLEKSNFFFIDATEFELFKLWEDIAIYAAFPSHFWFCFFDRQRQKFKRVSGLNVFKLSALFVWREMALSNAQISDTHSLKFKLSFGKIKISD